MNEFTYQNLTIERLDSIMRDIFIGGNTTIPRSWIKESYFDEIKTKSTEIMKGNELDIDITDRNRSYGDSRVYRYKINGETAMRFDQIPFPECCGIAIIKNFSANGDMSKADFLNAMDQFLADIKKNDRYSKVLFYTNTGSTGDRLFQLINGITILDPFRNKRSGNTLIGFEIDLLEKSTESGWQSMEFSDDETEDEEPNGEHDEDEEEDDALEIRYAVSEMRAIVEAQAILDGDTQPVADSTRISEATRGGRVIAHGRGIMEQIKFANPYHVDFGVDPNEEAKQAEYNAEHF